MTISPTLYSSESGKHRTPQALYDAANQRWGPFILDAAATVDDCLGNCFFLPDAFVCTWYGRVWLNPPYGEGEKKCKPTCKKKRCVKRGRHADADVPGIYEWVRRAFDQVLLNHAERVVCLLPARTDTRWWQAFINNNWLATVRYLPGRVSFLTEHGEESGPAPFPSAIVVFEKPFSYKRGK